MATMLIKPTLLSQIDSRRRDRSRRLRDRHLRRRQPTDLHLLSTIRAADEEVFEFLEA
jgi:hypothetical protein